MFLNFEGNNTIFDRMFILGFSFGVHIFRRAEWEEAL